MQFRRVIDYLEGICILHNDPGIAQNLEITEQKSELTITNLNNQCEIFKLESVHLYPVPTCSLVVMGGKCYIYMLHMVHQLRD